MSTLAMDYKDPLLAHGQLTEEEAMTMVSPARGPSMQ